MAEVLWSDEALLQLGRIVEHIEQCDSIAADTYGRRLFDAGESLGVFPNRGRAAEHGLRELLIVRPYIISYFADGDRVMIVSLRHGAPLPRLSR